MSLREMLPKTHASNHQTPQAKRTSRAFVAVCLAVTSLSPFVTIAAEADIAKRPLTTQAESRFSFTSSLYQYGEPSLEVELTGPKSGLGFRRTQPLPGTAFALFELDYRFGAVEYQADGFPNASGIAEQYLEIRSAIGRDFEFGNWVLAPYAGLGYRMLRNEFSRNPIGYDRRSRYVYLPIGFFHRAELGSSAQLETRLEGDLLLSGQQDSEFSDFDPAWDDAGNRQSRGHGYRASITYRKGQWGIGPYFTYWNIDDSNIDYIQCYTDDTCEVYEPSNTTREFGISVDFTALDTQHKPTRNGVRRPRSAGNGLYGGLQGSYVFTDANRPRDQRADTEHVLVNEAKFGDAAIGVFFGANSFSLTNLLIGAEFDASQAGSAWRVSSYAMTQEAPDDPDSPVDYSFFQDRYAVSQFGSARLRLGYQRENLLIYLTGGLAIARIDVRTAGWRGDPDSADDMTEQNITRRQGSDWIHGYTAGAGVEYPLTERVRLRAEYRLTDYAADGLSTTVRFKDIPRAAYDMDLNAQSLTFGLLLTF